MMDRKEFIKTCGLTCLTLAGISSLVSACAPTKYIQTEAKENKLLVAKSTFFKENPDSKKIHSYVIVKTGALAQPVVLYRESESVYTALLLQCTHQQLELNVNGNLITCSAHGSEFTSKGEVIQGPAEHNLKRYVVTQDQENIFIHLS